MVIPARVFQTFQLMPRLTALENVFVPIELSDAGGTASGDRACATAPLERVGLDDRLYPYPAQLSVGEQQRVANARARVSR